MNIYKMQDAKHFSLSIHSERTRGRFWNSSATCAAKASGPTSTFTAP